jgi:hypothetical protein
MAWQKKEPHGPKAKVTKHSHSLQKKKNPLSIGSVKDDSERNLFHET